MWSLQKFLCAQEKLTHFLLSHHHSFFLQKLPPQRDQIEANLKKNNSRFFGTFCKFFIIEVASCFLGTRRTHENMTAKNQTASNIPNIAQFNCCPSSSINQLVFSRLSPKNHVHSDPSRSCSNLRRCQCQSAILEGTWLPLGHIKMPFQIQFLSW